MIFRQKKNTEETPVEDVIKLIVHQLRAPLASLKFAQERLVETGTDNLTAEQHKLFHESSKRIQHLNELTQLLQTSIVSDFANLDRVEVKSSLGVFIDEIISEYSAIASEKNIHLKSSYDWGNDKILVDKDRLREALSNLIDNAIKYTEENGEVTVSLRSDKTHVFIDVADDGIGIPKGEEKALFNKFTRLSNAHETSAQGMGLGLYVTKQIIDAHGGEIRVSNSKRGGAVFTVALPIAL